MKIKFGVNASRVSAIAGILGLFGLLQTSHYHIDPPPEYGNCHLKTRLIPSLDRIDENFKEGISDVKNGRTDLAIGRFKSILDIDPNFLAGQLNLGSALLEQGKLGDAEKAFDAEMLTIDCLRSMNDQDLPKFAYLIDPAGKSAALINQNKLNFLRTKIQNDEDTVHYNRAHLKVDQKDDDQAIDQLRLAVKHNFIPKETLPDDPALKPLSRLPQFERLVKTGT